MLRELWARQGQASADLPFGTEDSCKSTRSIGFEGLAAAAGTGEDTSSGGGGGDLRAAWRATLRREGKLHPDSGTVADLVLGREAPATQSDEPRPLANTGE